METKPPPIGPDDALFLDFDGTLAEIAATPGEVRIDSRVPTLMSRWSRRLEGAVAVISGRPLADLLRFLSPYQGAMAGVYGLERVQPDGAILAVVPPPELAEARRVMQEMAARLPGVALEDKGGSFSVHYRANPEHADLLHEAARAAAGRHLATAPGKMVVEILPKGFDKGTAIAAYMAEAPFAGRRPIFVGDDRPDEAGFAYVNRLGGVSVIVGAPHGPTAARRRLANVAAVLAWLDDGASGGPNAWRAAS